MNERDVRVGRRARDVGGTPGGLGSFVLGTIMLVVGTYLLLQRVWVSGHSWRFFGYDAFGLSIVPLLFGVGLLFFDASNKIAWLVTAIGALIIVAGIIQSMHIFFRPTSLFDTLLVLFLMVGGLGLIGRSLRSS